jgi:hypothetical protein
VAGSGPSSVSDTLSMTDLKANVRIPQANICDHGRKQDKVMHTNYFEQAKTLEFIQKKFNNPA